MGLCRVLVYVTAAFCFSAAPANGLWLGAGALLSYLIGLSYAAKQENLGRIEHAWPLLLLALPLGVLTVIRDLPAAALCLLFGTFALYALSFLLRKAGRNIPRAVSYLIAGISLLDGTLAAAAGQPSVAALCVLGFLATLVGQRFIAGT
jgi:4-hydroxybenzoate polyprenyltransferase